MEEINLENTQETIQNIQKEIPNQPIIDSIINEIDKDIFFSVGVAKKKTNAVLKKKVEVSMLPIYDKINAAINNGQYFVECVLYEEQKSFLQKRNFWINYIKNDASGKSIYKIRWD